MNKLKIILLAIVVALFTSIIVVMNRDNTIVLDEVSLREVVNKSDSTFAIMIKTDVGGEYEVYTGSGFPDNMALNGDLSGCVDSDGNSLGDAFSYNATTKQATIKTNQSFRCFLYFDYYLNDAILLQESNSETVDEAVTYIKSKGTPTFSEIATTDEGLYYAKDDYGDSYYFRGAVEDNYVYFAGYYWRIIRVNGDGSIRLIYDGSTQAYGNGTSYINADRYVSSLGNYFNQYTGSSAYPLVGYMYGDFATKSEDTTIISFQHYFADDYEFDSETGLYTLLNGTQQEWSADVLDKYFCLNIEESCYTLYKVESYDDSALASGGALTGTGTIYTQTSSTDESGNTTYTESEAEGTFTDMFYYFAGYATNTNTTYPYSNYDFIYGGSPTGAYAISDTIVGTYTCFNGSYPWCNTLYLVDSVNSNGTANVYTLTLNSQNYDSMYENKYESTIKTLLDGWYEENILNQSDGRISYASYISDTLFCNDRSIYSGNGTGETYYNAYDRLYTNTDPILTCSNKNDAFTYKDTTYGNGNLTYSIGLITADEVMMAGANYTTSNTSYYLFNGYPYLTMTPGYTISNNMAYIIGFVDKLNSYMLVQGGLFKPVINLSSSVVVTGGDGSMDNPYTVSLL